jgi:hypothetical protein
VASLVMLGLERWNGGWIICAPDGQMERAAERREEELTPTRVLCANYGVVNVNNRIATINRDAN